MRFISSYGIALLLILGVGGWLLTGTLIQGGKGPGNGENPVVSLGGGGETEVSAEQQKLFDEVAAKRKTAEEAKSASEKAQLDAEKAIETANTADRASTAERDALKKESEEKTKVAEEAEKAAEEAIEAREAAEASAEKAKEKYQSFKTIAERNKENTGSEEKLRSVRVKKYLLGALPLEVTLRGRTKASSIVSAPAETTGIVHSVEVTKGQTVAIGDVLCKLDPSTRVAAVRQAEAAVTQAEASLAQSQLSFNSNASLRAKGLAAVNTEEQFTAELAGAEAGLQAAETGLANAEAELERTEIRAKINGLVQAPIVDEGVMLAMGAPCATIVQLDPMLFVGNVPEARIEMAKTGLSAEVSTIGGQSAEGKVTYISSVADDATRSFPVEIELTNTDGRILDGLTAEAKVSLGTIPAHMIPQSVLTLDDDGVLGVRAVSNGVVAFHAVTIVSDTRDGVWVLGLPPAVEIITVGQEFVKAGQKVDAGQTAEG